MEEFPRNDQRRLSRVCQLAGRREDTVEVGSPDPWMETFT